MTGRAADRPAALAAMIWTGVVSVYTTVVLPLIVSAAGVSFGLAPARAGLIASAEMAGIAIGTFATALIVARADRRRLVIAGALVAAAANLASILPVSFGALLPLRVVSGIGSGALLATMAAAVGATRAPERNFAIFVAGAFVAAAISFGRLAALTAAHGVTPVFVVLAVLNLSTLPASPAFGREREPGYADAGAPAAAFSVTPPVVLALLGILAFYLGIGSVWPMMSAIGTSFGLKAAAVGDVLAGTSIAALIGAMAAAVLGTRLGRALPLLAGLATVVATLAWLVTLGRAAFATAPLLFLLSWNFSVPYMMGTLAVLDRSGRAVAFNMTLQYIGFACGPLIAAAVVDRGSVLTVARTADVGCVLCLMLFAAALVTGRSLLRGASARP